MVVRASSQPQKVQVPAVVKPAIATVVANVIMAMPALAEPGKLFDFNLTLPVMAGELLLLMVFLDKFWFGPVGKVLDERDSQLRNQLSTVKDGSSEINKLTSEAEDLVKAARTEVTAMINKQKGAKQSELDVIYADAKAKVTRPRTEVTAMINKQKGAKQSELDAIYADAKAKVTRETDSAIAVMEKESEGLLASLDAQAEKISTEVLRRVLPEGVKI